MSLSLLGYPKNRPLHIVYCSCSRFYRYATVSAGIQINTLVVNAGSAISGVIGSVSENKTLVSFSICLAKLGGKPGSGHVSKHLRLPP